MLFGGVSGAVMALGLQPFGQWHISLFGILAAFLLFSRSNTQRSSALMGWSIGVGYFAVGLNWIVEPFMVEADVTGWMAPFALLLMAGGLALFWGLAFWGSFRFCRGSIWGLAVFWTIAEMARGYVLTGFPWATLGYIWAADHTIQWVSLVGPYGLTLMTCCMIAAVANTILSKTVVPSVSIATILGLALVGGGRVLLPEVQDLTGQPVVRLVQPNAPQHEKWASDKIPVFFDRQVGFTNAEWQLDAEPSLIVWPETALPMLLNHAEQAFDIISEAAGPASVVVGIQREENGDYFNSLTVLNGQGQVEHVYDKHHLVPFGEYMPFAWLFEKWNILGLAARASSAYTRGSGPDVIALDGFGVALPLICYEAVFPQDVHGAKSRPDLLLQVTNDAWFGNWSGPYQHLSQARIRAIEQGVPMIRAANTGVSAVIDGAGRILAHIPLNEAGFVDAYVPAPLRLTLYSRTGDFPVFCLLVAFALLTIWKETRPNSLTVRLSARSRD